jgi:fluoride exporter
VSRFLLVCLGGALGSGARYLVATWALATFGPGFPRGTLLVNVAGSFLLGLVMIVSLQADAIAPDVRVFLSAGVLGGFTTYSSFNYEALALIGEGRHGTAAAYLGMTIAGCLVAGGAGMILGRWLAG